MNLRSIYTKSYIQSATVLQTIQHNAFKPIQSTTTTKSVAPSKWPQVNTGLTCSTVALQTPYQGEGGHCELR